MKTKIPGWKPCWVLHVVYTDGSEWSHVYDTQSEAHAYGSYLWSNHVNPIYEVNLYEATMKKTAQFTWAVPVDVTPRAQRSSV